MKKESEDPSEHSDNEKDSKPEPVESRPELHESIQEQS